MLSLIILIFFVPYVLVQLPSSILIRKLGARAFLAGITFAWGLVMIVSTSYLFFVFFLET